MDYKVVNRFTDRDKHTYEVGDPYPKEGSKATKKRIDELSEKHSKYKRIFIEEVKKKAEKKAEKR